VHAGGVVCSLVPMGGLASAAAEAVRQAAVEGLTLERSGLTLSGFSGIGMRGGRYLRLCSGFSGGDRLYGTAEEAALERARSIQGIPGAEDAEPRRSKRERPAPDCSADSTAACAPAAPAAASARIKASASGSQVSRARSLGPSKRLGPRFQAVLPPWRPRSHAGGAAGAGAAAPRCRCGGDAVWQRGRWWCAREERGCGFEAWLPRVAHRLAAPSLAASSPDVGPLLLRDADMETELGVRTAALLTHAAFGPLNDWTFTAPSDAGLGVFARSPLRPGQALGEYGGPRLPLDMLTEGKGDYSLEMPSCDDFIDGACENSPFDDGKRFPACFANHSRLPNARSDRESNRVLAGRALSHIYAGSIEEWPNPSGSPFDVEHRMWLVASETIEAGHEIRSPSIA
jgi:hypothetical protein